jgi:hydroxypyruvate reductase
MAQALEAVWPGKLDGVVVGRHGTSAKLERIKYLTAAHPVPDAAGLAASATLLACVAGLTADDLVMALISGGGSALLPAPADGLTLDDEIKLNQLLLASGAPISAMNAIRKCFSRIKGGRLALAAAPARVVTFVVSDVPGDDPALVASGPTIADSSGRNEAVALIKDYDIQLPPDLRAFLQTAPEPPKPHAAEFAKNKTMMVASASRSLAAAAEHAELMGVTAHILSDAIEGESREVAKVHAGIATFASQGKGPFQRPCVILSGGETTVTIGSATPGRGGRNAEFLLSFARAISGTRGITCLAADTDGIDGTQANAGGWVDGTTISRIVAAGQDPAALLKAHDSWAALNAASCLFETGPTGTNVNDFRAILIE